MADESQGSEKAEGPSGQATEEKPNAWGPLRNPTFRALWIANAVSNIGTWMQNTAMAWVMATIAPTAVMVSLVQTAASLPIFLLALPAGAIADVMDRRRIMIFTQIWMLIAATILGVLTLLDLTTPWILLALVLALGIGTALNAPAWQAIIPELVPRDQIRAGVALNSAGFNLARAVGPALGGLVLVALGAGATFMINAASFLGVILVILFWKRPRGESALPAERIFAAMRTGIRFVRHARALQAVFIRAFSFIVCASSLVALLPLFARNFLQAGPSGYGVLLGSFGLGAVAGASVLPPVLRKISLDALARCTSLIFAAVLSFLALVHGFALDCAATFLAGAAWLALLSTLNSCVQSIAPAWVRGRCLAVYMLIFFGGMAGASFAWGAVANVVGIPAALHISALSMVVGLLATSRFKLISGERLDLTPSSHWAGPPVIFEPQPRDGPVMVTVEYRIDPADWREFGIALRRLRRARLRGGAFRWTVFMDLSDPQRYCETFLVESWLEHLRQHERVTVADREIEGKVRAFHKGETRPVVSHLLAKPLPKEE
ncbi:MAG: MFS transporter [Syntrophobacteraceae bacterium]